MTFTTEQIERLSQWEEHFHTAVHARWSRNPGTSGLRVIWETYTKATGDQRRFNDNCNHCILSLLRDCGQIYFRDKAELEKMQNSAKTVEVSEEPAEPVKKVAVKTTKRKTKTSKKTEK